MPRGWCWGRAEGWVPPAVPFWGKAEGCCLPVGSRLEHPKSHLRAWAGSRTNSPKPWAPGSKGDPQLQPANRETEARGRREWAQGPILPVQSSISELEEEPEQLEAMKII